MFTISDDLLQAVALEQNVSPIELETLKLALSGKSATEIATILDVSAVAIRKRLGSVYQKFNLPGNSPGKLEVLRSLLSKKYQSSQTSEVRPRRDWGEAVDVSEFYGREWELETLEQWTIKKHCRLIALLGMGGIGKTALSIKLAQKIEREFDFVVWRSLRSAPPVTEVLADLIKFFSNGRETDLPKDVAGKTRKLINEYLRENRCLIVLDNLESILQSGTRAGAYKDEYQDYSEFLRLVGEMPHSSCVVLTSREKPKEVASLEGINRPTRVLQLNGLKEAGKEIFKAEGLSEAENEWSELIEHYAGNPLALRIATTTIRELFGGNITQFVEEGLKTFGDIRDLLEEQLERLSDLEMQIMFWLAIEREPVSISKLSENLVVPPVAFKLLEAVESLKRRSLIEVDGNGASFSLQNVIVEYLYERLVEKICEEIKNEELDFFNNYALVEATAKDYVREAQSCLILEPIKERLLALLKGRSHVEKRARQMIETLQDSSDQPGYAAGNILNLLCLLKSNLRDFDFSDLVIWQAYLQNANLQFVNFANSKFAQSIFTKIFGRILSVAFSPDGNTLATGDTNGEILVWQIKNSKLQWRLKADSNYIRSLAFSPDGNALASASENQIIKIWSLSSGKCVKILNEPNNQVWSIAFSPDGNTLATGGEDRSVRIWSVEDGECQKTLQGHSDCVRSVAFSTDGKILASGSEDNSVKIWSVEDGKCKTLQGHSKWVRSVAFSTDGKILASGSEDNSVKIWSVEDGKCIKTLQGHSKWVWSVAFSPNSRILATGSADQTVKMWSVKDGKCIKTLQGHSNWVQSVAFSPNGQILASGSTDQTVKMWSVKDGKCIKTLQGHSNWMRTIAFSTDGKTLVSGGEDKTVKMWSVEDGKCIKTLQNHSNWVHSVAFSPDNQYVASSSPDRTIQIWEIMTGECRKIVEEDGNWARTLAFSPNSQTLASGNENGTVKIWSVKDGKCIKTLAGHDSWVSSIAFSPDGKILASGSTDRTIRIWNWNREDTPIKTLEGHSDWVWSVAFSPDGQTLASGSADRTIKIWSVKDVEYFKSLQTFEGHDNTVSSVAFSPDGKILASGSEDNSVKMWSVEDGKCIKTIEEHNNWIASVLFSPDGQILASTSMDGMIKLWNVKTAKIVNILRSSRPYEEMDITGVEGLSDAQKATLEALGAKSKN
ncbi:MAG: NB-ARC domain-containing protein [Cyanobacteria bacterium P01_G01_bin.19]